MTNSAERLDMNFCIASQMQARGLKVRDAGETANFARELEYLQAEAIEAKFPEYKGLSLVPVYGNAIPLGARSHTYREVTGFGEAELLETMAPEDFPTADVQGKEITGTFRTLGAKYHVTIEDLRAASLMSINVDAQRSKLARKAIEGKLDRLVWEGGGPFKGLLDDAMSVDDSSSDDWNTGTVDGDIAAIRATLQRVKDTAFSDTAGIFPDYDLVLCTPAYLKMGLWLPATVAGGGLTVGQFVLQNMPGLRSISHCGKLDGKGAGGKGRNLAYPRDPEVLEALVPTRFESFAPQLSGMQFTTFCAAKYGGIRVHHPKAVRRFDVSFA